MKHIIFDFDGTLADSTAVFASAWNTLAQKYKFKGIELKEIDTLKKLSISERSKLFDFPMYKLPMILPQFYKLYRQSLNDVHLFDGMKEVLMEIDKRGYKIIIISSNSKENILAFLKMNGIHCVADVLCSNRIFGKDKVMKKFLKDSNVNSADVLYIGDEQRDIVACKKAGVPIVWVEWGYDAIEVVQNENPEYKVATPQEILEII
ncbi:MULTISPECIES: HAD-IA family hydrolase [Lysinibacillus]|jgi:phosphoglycolate phosphatase|uniref:HAD family hydrolase n=1 Tax=Lysinibacillus fusiformis TaxID=28031 RepID=A0A2I0V3E6_9BACI|nr:MULTISPECIES: HAD-IA family hydrolase [Lysinibacillus]KUF31762.1 HAD family hydrolase [Lysinibacillus sp. F5]MEE3809019.1 HAD-IA family hydrolase [Lysinibacillus fusiformis]PKU52835.1 HAD family hydrolase [Lysinibacillus fusiformis]WCH49212.1 HAD-IA family hydrolase [Lysinibacillus sp. OF-1]SCY61591.1 phosphoglycolate phosphatase [Lysinibacillus sp. SG9]